MVLFSPFLLAVSLPIPIYFLTMHALTSLDYAIYARTLET